MTMEARLFEPYNFIAVSKTSIDICGGINEALVLDYLLSDKPEEVFKDGKYYKQVKRADWYEIARLSPKQYDVAIKKLISYGFVKTKVFRTENGDLSTHIWIDYEAIGEARSGVIGGRYESES